jgi:Ca2+-binding EF-hand superfamily protein
MAAKEVHERIVNSGGRISTIEYVYSEAHATGSQAHTISVKREEYERLASKSKKPTLPFDEFVKVIRVFMMGKHASVGDIPEAFRALDTNHSGQINLNELAAFMPVIVPNTTPEMLVDYIRQVDKNHDLRLNLTEFTDLIAQNIGRKIALGRK